MKKTNPSPKKTTPSPKKTTENKSSKPTTKATSNLKPNKTTAKKKDEKKTKTEAKKEEKKPANNNNNQNTEKATKTEEEENPLSNMDIESNNTKEKNDEELLKCVMTLSNHKDWVNKIIQLSNKNILTCSEDKTIKLWDLSELPKRPIPLTTMFLPKDSLVNYLVTGGLVVLMGFINALASGGFFNFVSYFPLDLIVSFSAGQGFSGIALNVLEYIVLLALKGDEEKMIIIRAWIFFGISSVILVVCLILVLLNYNSEFTKFYLSKITNNDIPEGSLVDRDTLINEEEQVIVSDQDDLCMCFPTLPDEENTLGENDNFENKNFINGKIVKEDNEDEEELKLVKPFNRYETVELNLDL